MLYYLSSLVSETLHSIVYFFPFLLCLSRLFSQLFVRSLRQPLCPVSSLCLWDGFGHCCLYNVMNLCPSFFRHSIYKILQSGGTQFRHFLICVSGAAILKKNLNQKCRVSQSVVSNSLEAYRMQTARLLCPWTSLGKNTGVGCHFFLQRIFPTQGSKPGLHFRRILYHLSHYMCLYTHTHACARGHTHTHTIFLLLCRIPIEK